VNVPGQENQANQVLADLRRPVQRRGSPRVMSAIKRGSVENHPNHITNTFGASSMRRFIFSMSLAAACILVIYSVGKSQEQKNGNSKEVTSNQLLMRDKLVQMNHILEGLTLDKFDQVEESAKMLGMISRATSWHIANPTPRYERLSKNFQEQAVDLERHAKDRNIDAATLDLVRMNVTCAQCHQHMRETAARTK
jgi:hypothetical protein